MQTFVCPDEILDLLDEPETREVGEERLGEWICTLPGQLGDKLLLPCDCCGALHAMMEYEPIWLH
jgi:hypothetical protein